MVVGALRKKNKAGRKWEGTGSVTVTGVPAQVTLTQDWSTEHPGHAAVQTGRAAARALHSGARPDGQGSRSRRQGKGRWGDKKGQPRALPRVRREPWRSSERRSDTHSFPFHRILRSSEECARKTDCRRAAWEQEVANEPLHQSRWKVAPAQARVANAGGERQSRASTLRCGQESPADGLNTAEHERKGARMSPASLAWAGARTRSPLTEIAGRGGVRS